MTDNEHQPTKPTAKAKCGVVMPISSIENCSEAHWSDVRSILYDAIEDAEFDPNLVSDADDAGIIQKRIIQNLYENPIVVCDISCKNANVMFELGIRLAFDKPTIVVKDEETPFSFDTSPIEHLQYPRDLRFNQIVDFKAELTAKIKATHKAATTNPDYTTFLKHFGTFSVAKLDSKEITGSEMIVEEIRELRSQLRARKIRSSSVEVDEMKLSRFSAGFPEAIRRYLREHGLRRKADIRAARSKIRDAIEFSGDFNCCGSHDEYEAYFNSMFDVMYPE